MLKKLRLRCGLTGVMCGPIILKPLPLTSLQVPCARRITVKVHQESRVAKLCKALQALPNSMQCK